MIQPGIHEAFCENVKARRIALGLTQTELAERMRVSQPSIAGIEAGRRVPLLTTVEQVAEALECSALELLTPSKENSDLVA